MCGSEPEASITVTTLYLDHDYVVDQVFEQHAALLSVRLDPQEFADELYPEPAQILDLSEERVGMLTLGGPRSYRAVSAGKKSPHP